jgi:hypothetical protein
MKSKRMLWLIYFWPTGRGSNWTRREACFVIKTVRVKLRRKLRGFIWVWKTKKKTLNNRRVPPWAHREAWLRRYRNLAKFLYE